MAYITADRTREIKKELKAKFPNLTFSVRREHYTSVDVAIVAGDVDFSDLLNEDGRTYKQLNHYYLDNYGKHSQLFKDIYKIVDEGNYNNSDSMTDYFDVGFYVDMSIGKWDKPYQYVGAN